MRKYFKQFTTILFLLPLLLFSSCLYTIEQSEQKFKWPRDSFVKYEIFIYKQTCQPADPDNLKSECYTRESGFTGSGSIIASGFDGSYILTAAHMCDRRTDLRILQEQKENSPGDTFFAKHYVRDLDDFTYNANIVSYDSKLDACVVHVWGLFKSALTIASEGPKIGDTAYNMAAPAGFFKKDLVPLFKGFYTGEWDPHSAVYTIPAIAGSSGSPILNNRSELIGLVYARHHRFHHIVLSPTFKKLRNFILGSIKEHSEKRSKNQGLDLQRSIIIKFNK